MKIGIEINDQLFVNNKWYFDIININDNIVQVRIKYKENPNIETYLYKSINLDKSLFLEIEKEPNTHFIKCEIDEIKLRKTIGNLISRIKIEIDYSFIYEDGGGAASSANTGGMGAVTSAGISSIPGAQGTPGSGDIGQTLGPSIKLPSNTLGVPYEKHKKRKKKKVILKSPILKIENYINMDNDLKSKLLELINYPEQNEYDQLFINDIIEKKELLMNRSKDVIVSYLNDLLTLNATKLKYCSDWFKNEIENIKQI